MTLNSLTKSARISYLFIFLLLVGTAWMHLGLALIAVMLSFFTLEKLHFVKAKSAAIAIFAVLVLGVFYGAAHFIHQAFIALPKIAETSIPSVIRFAEERGWELPFTDSESLKAMALDEAKDQIAVFGRLARFAGREFAVLLLSFVVAAGLFVNSVLDLEREQHAVRNNLYSAICVEISARFTTFYHSFATVMGAQIIISAINTALTSLFVFAVSLPHAPVMVGVTFLCGLLPIVGNLISNTIIVGVAFSVSPTRALWAFLFLVVIHKLEYFLNSKIIGDRIQTPVWLTLLGLILGERLMGIPGMILAPVVLHYLKVEMTRIDVSEGTPQVAGPYSPAPPPARAGE